LLGLGKDLLDHFIYKMNSLRYETGTEDDWLLAMKKEMKEAQKSKEKLYNFNFDDDKTRTGKFLWEVVAGQRKQEPLKE